MVDTVSSEVADLIGNADAVADKLMEKGMTDADGMQLIDGVLVQNLTHLNPAEQKQFIIMQSRAIDMMEMLVNMCRMFDRKNMIGLGTYVKQAQALLIEVVNVNTAAASTIIMPGDDER